jgi:hypothetical protein
LLAAVVALSDTRPLAAQACEVIATRTAPGAFSGERIASIRIVTRPPDRLPGAPAFVGKIHIRTQESTVRRDLLFAVGDTVDTLRMAETMRRIRFQRYIDDAELEARWCGADSAVALTVTTRDSWSTRTDLRFGASKSTALSLQERNVLGTGRAASVYLQSVNSRLGVGASLYDPWVPHTNLSALVRRDVYRDGGDWFVDVETRRRSVFDPWHTELALWSSARQTTGDTADVFQRKAASFLVARSVSTSAYGVTALLTGVEGERTRLLSSPDAAIVGPCSVRRDFVGLDVGLRRDAATFDTLTWLVGGRGLADLPVGFEGEGVVGIGKDFVREEPLVHLDLWGGRIWQPDRRHVVVADVWSSGYLGQNRWDDATVRGSLTMYRRAHRGVWLANLAGERLFNPDPDVRALATLDHTIQAYPKRSRLAESALAASLERDVHIMSAMRSWTVDGALFSAASLRWNPVSPSPDQLYAGVVGVGLRLVPIRAGRGTFRLDLGFPVARSPELRGRPFVALTVVPWLGASRARDGWWWQQRY